MSRILTAGVVGAIIYSIWGMMAWLVFPLHAPTIHALPAERAVADLFVEQDLESGVYIAPFAATSEDLGNPDSDFNKNHASGPIISIFYRKEGGARMPLSMRFLGFVIDILAASLAAWLLSNISAGWGQSYRCRVGFVAGLGVFAAIVGHLSYWNWNYFPLGYTMAYMVDVIVGWTLAGLAIALLIEPDEQTGSSYSNSSAGRADSRPATPVTPVAAAKPTPVAPLRNDAINLLATLQREARFVDIVKEPLGDYSDAQVGAAARDVLRDCGVVLDRLFKLQPVVDEEEGAKVDIPAGAESGQYRIAGNASSDAKSGSLVHHGWRAQQCELPKWTGAKAAALIVSPAELEVK